MPVSPYARANRGGAQEMGRKGKPLTDSNHWLVCSTSDEGREVRDGAYDPIRTKPKLFGRLPGAALNPERNQPRGRRAVDVPRVRRDKAQLCVADVHSLGTQVIDPRAGFEDFDFLDTYYFVEEIINPSAFRRRL